MPISCRPTLCGCSFRSPLGTIVVSQVGAEVSLETADASVITDLQDQVDQLIIDLAALTASTSASLTTLSSNQNDLLALISTVSTSITATGVGSSAAGFAFKVPIAGSSNDLVVYNFIVTNNKGSNLVAGDDLATFPVGYRPVSTISQIQGAVVNSNLQTLVSISTAGLVEHVNGTVVTGQSMRFIGAFLA